MMNGCAAGICDISAELLKADGACVVSCLTVIQQAWESGSAPDDWKRGIILPFYKNKGARSECKNYRGITLLSVPGKIYAHSVLKSEEIPPVNPATGTKWFHSSQIHCRPDCHSEADSTTKT